MTPSAPSSPGVFLAIRDAVEQIARFLGRQHGRLAFLDGVFGAAHGVGGIHVQNAARHQPMEQHTHEPANPLPCAGAAARAAVHADAEGRRARPGIFHRPESTTTTRARRT